MSDSHLVAVMKEDLGGNTFKDHKTRWPIKRKKEEGRLSTQSSEAQLKI